MSVKRSVGHSGQSLYLAVWRSGRQASCSDSLSAVLQQQCRDAGGGSTGIFAFFRNCRCQFGPFLGLAGAPRYFNRAPHASLVTTDWSTARNKPLERFPFVLDENVLSMCYLCVTCILLFVRFSAVEGCKCIFLMKSGLLWLSASYLPEKQGL